MEIRDRIRELRRVPAGALRPNPRNWRTHPDEQRAALRGVLAEIGYADALLARECEDGSLELVDGHLRAETTPDMHVPVLVLDLTEDEAAKLLAVLDPLSALAGRDQERIDALVADVDTDNAAVQELLDRLAADVDDAAAAAVSAAVDENQPSAVVELYQVTVECQDEAEQRALYERLSAEGFKCRLLVL